MRVIRIATRGSALALWQTRHVGERLAEAHEGLEAVPEVLRTTGDRITDVPLSAIGDRGLFTKEVDRAVLDGSADIAVHSLKDLPTVIEPGLVLSAVLVREDPRDAYVPAPGAPERLLDLPEGARVGTSSLRRRSQLLALRPDLDVTDLRGNLDTRLRRLREGGYHAVLVAVAGLRRLGLESAIGEMLSPPDWLPAVGQGALAVVGREDGGDVLDLLAALDHAPTRRATAAERAFLRSLEGGCQIPIGALGLEDTGGALRLDGLVASLDGRTIVRGVVTGNGQPSKASDDPHGLVAAEALGRRLADRLLEEGAAPVLESIRSGAATGVPEAPAP